VFLIVHNTTGMNRLKFNWSLTGRPEENSKDPLVRIVKSPGSVKPDGKQKVRNCKETKEAQYASRVARH
jgi:hypothetical protein